MANPAYQPSVETKTAVNEALKVSSSQPARAARVRPADGFEWVWSDGRVFIRDIVAVGGQKRSRAMGKPFPGTPENDCGTRSIKKTSRVLGWWQPVAAGC